MSLADLPSNCGDTLNQRLQSQQKLQQQRVSRAGLVYGSSFSRGSCLDGTGIRRSPEDFDDMWYDAERFQLDHINEVLTKLNDGSLDDEIWGKIVVMERCKRIAKAYLRKTTVIVDGGDEEFDGKTLGFNFFTNPMRDEYTKELRAKIGDGVIIKMDNQGNIKAMARGSTPIFVQGWKDSKSHCISDKVIRNHGKLITKSSTAIQNDEDRVVKIFDMRRFKQCVERDPYETDMDARNLLLKSCVRVALVKDGGANDPLKTPCWFMIINLVALDMLKTKLPTVCSNPILYAQNTLNSGINESTSSRLSRIMSQVSLVPPSSSSNNNADLYSNPALTHLIAAAMHQQHQHQQNQQQHYAGNMSGKLASSSSAINMEQIAKLASTLSLANPNLLNGGSNNNYQHSSSSSFRRIRRSRSFSDSDDSEIDNRLTAVKNAAAAYSGSTTGSSSGISGFGDRQKRFGDLRQQQIMAKSVDALHESRKEDSSKNGGKDNKYAKSARPRLSENLFQKPIEEATGVKPWKSCASTTSDYDSNKEVFDSGSWSSNSRVSSKEDEPRSYSPSIPSDVELHHSHHSRHHHGSGGDRRNSAPHEIANAAAFIARQRHQQLIRRVSSKYDSSTTPSSSLLLSPYRPVYTKRNTLPTKGSRKIRRAISRRDIDQKNAANTTARAVSPKPPMVQLPSIESPEQPQPPSSTTQRTAVCIPIQRNNLATSASDNVPVKSDEGNNSNDNNNPISTRFQQQRGQAAAVTSIPTPMERQHQSNNIPTQPAEFRNQQPRFPRIRKESSTDSEASDVQSEIEVISATATTPLTRQHPIRRAMGSQGVGAYAAAATTLSTSKSSTTTTAATTAPSTINRKFNLPKSPPSIRVRTPSRTVSQSTPKYSTNQAQPQQQQNQSSENRVYDAQSLRPWKTRREPFTATTDQQQPQQRETINFKQLQMEQQHPNANVMRTEQDQFIHHNGAYNPTKVGQIPNSISSRMPRRTSSKESRNAMSSEQSSFRERAWATSTTTSTMAPTIQRWLNADTTKSSINNNNNNSNRKSMEASNSNISTKTTAAATATTNIWRHHRNGPWDELLASKQRDKERNQQQQFQQASQQQQHQRRESTTTATNMGMENQRGYPRPQSQQQISTISNHHHPPQQQSPTTNVRSLRNYYTELQQQKQHTWNQQQQTLCSTTILTPPRMKRLQSQSQSQQSQQYFRHSYHRSMDAMILMNQTQKEIPPIPKLSKLLPQNSSHHSQHQQSSNRFCQFPPISSTTTTSAAAPPHAPPPPPPPQPPKRLASIVPKLQSNNFCIN